MPSIFIWKAEKPSQSKKNIHIYSGSNWTLEDYECSSKSFKYCDQIVIPGFTDSVITFKIKNMPKDWIGSELLEVRKVLYEFIKSDKYGILERIGDWMRFTLLQEIEYNEDNLNIEFKKIKYWINNNNNNNKEFHNNYDKKIQFPTISLDPEKIKNDFQQFLIKFDVPRYNLLNQSKHKKFNKRNN